MHYMIVDYGR